MKATECKYCKITMQLIAQAHREGWEQGKREASGIIDDTEEVESMSVYAQLGDAHRTKMSIADAIAAMEYGRNDNES